MSDKPKCTFCGRTDDLAVDHILPQSRGGRSQPGNLQWLCCSCNGKKRNRTNDEYLHRLCEAMLRPEYEVALDDAARNEAVRLVKDHGSVEAAIRDMYARGHIVGRPIPTEPIFGPGPLAGPATRRKRALIAGGS